MGIRGDGLLMQRGFPGQQRGCVEGGCCLVGDGGVTGGSFGDPERRSWGAKTEPSCGASGARRGEIEGIALDRESWRRPSIGMPERL